MFAYCNNNPANYTDSAGCFAISIAIIIGSIVSNIIGTGFLLAELDRIISLSTQADALVAQIQSEAQEANNSTDNSQSAEKPTTAAPASPQAPNNNNRNNRNRNNNNNTPKNNQAQNRQIDDICNRVGLSKYQRRQLHEEISGNRFSYQEILEIAYEIKGIYNK